MHCMYLSKEWKNTPWAKLTNGLHLLFKSLPSGKESKKAFFTLSFKYPGIRIPAKALSDPLPLCNN